MAGKTKYRVSLTFASGAGLHRKGEVVELSDAEAKKFHKAGAISLYIPDGEEHEEELPKPKKKVRTGKPAAPTLLDDSKLLDPDPSAR